MAPGEEGARTSIKILDQKVGWVNVDADGNWTLTLRTRREEYRRAILAIFEYAATGDTAGGERVQEASRCGRCFRTLTDPVSIDRGIGPECLGRDTGSQHIAADRDRNGTAVQRPRTTSEALRQAGTDEAELAAEAARQNALRRGAHPDQADGDAFGAYEAVQERRAYEREMEQEHQAPEPGMTPREPEPPPSKD